MEFAENSFIHLIQIREKVTNKFKLEADFGCNKSKEICNLENL